MAARRSIDLAPPPRRVSWTAIAQTMLGGMRQMVWLVAAFLTIFFWVFALDSELMTKLEMRGPRRMTNGVVTDIRTTSARENSARVIAVDYTYRIGDVERRGTSFAVRRQLPTIGGLVLVEYRLADPSASRIAGLRRHRFGLGGGLVVGPYFVAILVALVNALRALREVRLLRRGELAFGKLVAKTATAARINKQRVFRYTFEIDLPAPARSASYRESAAAPRPPVHRFTVKTHRGARLKNDALEPVLYEPTRPGRGLAIDVLAVKPSRGGFDAPASALWVLIAPAFVIVGNVVYLLVR